MLGAALFGLSARSQAAPAGDEKELQAQEHHDNGTDFFHQKKYAECAAEFIAAHNVKPLPDFLFNAAVCDEKMKDYEQAIKLFEQYLKESPNAGDKKVIEDRIAKLKALQNPTVGAKPATPLPEANVRGVTVIDSNPAGAQIYLDDKKNGAIGATPWNGQLEGEHTIILEAKGFKPLTKRFSFLPAKYNQLYLEMSQEHYLGWIELRANIAGADVFLDEEASGAVGKTPYLANITPGKHKIFVSKEGYSTETKDIEIESGKSHKIEVVLNKEMAGFIHVSGPTVDGAVVKLDGKKVCDAAPCRFKSPSGDHKVTVDKAGQKPYNRTMNIRPATDTQLQVTLKPYEGKSDVIWNFVFAAAFIGGGVALGIHGNGIYDEIQSDIDRGMPPVSPNDDRFLKGKLFLIGADALYVIGGITAITGIVGLLKEKGPPSTGVAETKDLSWQPVIGPNYAGITAGVRW